MIKFFVKLISKSDASSSDGFPNMRSALSALRLRHIATSTLPYVCGGTSVSCSNRCYCDLKVNVIINMFSICHQYVICPQYVNFSGCIRKHLVHLVPWCLGAPDCPRQVPMLGPTAAATLETGTSGHPRSPMVLP